MLGGEKTVWKHSSLKIQAASNSTLDGSEKEANHVTKFRWSSQASRKERQRLKNARIPGPSSMPGGTLTHILTLSQWTTWLTVASLNVELNNVAVIFKERQ